jgi:hypothetical protein
VLSGVIALSCCLGPSVVVRVVFGNVPIWSYQADKVKEGMTEDEVEAALGSPHERLQNEREEDGTTGSTRSASITLASISARPDGLLARTETDSHSGKS